MSVRSASPSRGTPADESVAATRVILSPPKHWKRLALRLARDGESGFVILWNPRHWCFGVETWWRGWGVFVGPIMLGFSTLEDDPS